MIQKLIEGMNDQLNREVSTFLRYMQQAAAIRGAEWDAVRSMYLSEVTDEVGHAQYLANMIEQLGGRPKLSPSLSPPPRDVREMLRKDAEAERDDVKNYRDLAGLAEEAGLMAIKLQMEEQAADEDNHRMEMLRLLGE